MYQHIIREQVGTLLKAGLVQDETAARAELERYWEDKIADVWCDEDVLMLRPDLTREQAIDVLQRTFDKKDSSIGINWDVLSIYADDMFPARRDNDARTSSE